MQRSESIHSYMPAEWEPQKMTQLTFPRKDSDWQENYEEILKTYLELIATITRFQPVLLICDEVKRVKQIVPTDFHEEIIWAELPYNDTWCRDYGGVTIMEGTQRILLDFTFNGWGEKYPANLDNEVTAQLASKGYFGDNQYRKINFVLEGGSIDTNGEGILLTTSQCLLHPNRNPGFSILQIEHVLKTQLAAKKVLWLDKGHLRGDDTDGHIDMLARFAAKDCIFYASCDSANGGHYPSLPEMKKSLKRFTDLEGKPFHLIPLPVPGAIHDKNGNRLPASYLNFLFINGAVLVPQYQKPQDDKVLAIFSNFFPEKEIIGINCVPLIQQGGAIHCASMQYY